MYFKLKQLHIKTNKFELNIKNYILFNIGSYLTTYLNQTSPSTILYILNPTPGKILA